VQFAPDIVVEPNEELGHYITCGDIHKPLLVEQVDWNVGSHRPDGIFLAHGADIRPNADAPPVQIIDLAPTIMYQLGVPVPDDLEGRIVKEAFTGSPEKRTIEAAATGGSLLEPSSRPSSPGRYTDREQELLRQRLTNLGYMD